MVRIMLKLDSYNDSKEISLTAASFTREVCRPFLNQLNIAGFTLVRIYKDGGRLYLSNSEKWIEYYYNENYFTSTNYELCKSFNKVILWKQWPKGNIKFLKLIKEAKENFNYEHGIHICRVNEKYADAFSLRGYINDDDVNYRYLTHFQIIEKFLDFFLLQSQSIISKAYKNRFVITETIKDIPGNNLSKKNCDFEEENLSYQALEIFKKNNQLLDSNGIFFSIRESECIYLLFMGKGTKEIAKDLQISPRTVEVYLSNIKSKLNLYSKGQIITKILSDNLNKKLISKFLNLI